MQPECKQRKLALPMNDIIDDSFNFNLDIVGERPPPSSLLMPVFC